MLLSMQQPNATAPSPTSPSFAGLLAALTAPSQNSQSALDGGLPPAKKLTPAWNDDGLADDVATLSYERALRAHARYRSPAVADQPFTQSVDPEPIQPDSIQGKESSPDIFAAKAQPAAQPLVDTDPEPDQLRTGIYARNLKDASITIRMSKAECAQLHKRAVEAGLTVSAYLRSCTFEAESLRAEVKKALTELKSGAQHVKASNHAQILTPEPRRRSWLGRMTGWLARLLTPWHGSQRVVRA